MKDNKTKVITIAALIIAVIALSIGFAAFASTLNISTGASVTPTDNFSVKFSKEDTSLVENQSVLPTQASTASGDGANILNGENPTIGTLTASFTQPGQKVEYIFYVRNMGPYDAYLTDVRFNNAEGGTSFKKCEATGSNPVSNANDMCEYITFKLELAGLATPLTSTLDISSVIGNNYVVNKSLTPESGNTNSKLVKVTIEYPGDAPYADGSFNVTFGNVEMVFASLAGYIPQVINNNIWVTQKNLTSNNVVFDRLYEAISNNPVWGGVNNFMLNSQDGSLSLMDGAMTVDSATMNDIATIGSNYIIIDASSFGVDVYQVIEFNENGNATFYEIEKPFDISVNDPLSAIKTAYGTTSDRNLYTVSQ